MSGKKSKLARKMARLEEANKNRRLIGEIDRQPALSADLFIPYMLSKFSGKAGYKYVSVGGYGSLFLSDKYADIVPIALHREFPETSARKRFNDRERRDIVVNVVHVYPGFRGFVVDKNANVYIGGISAPATKDEIDALLTFGAAAEGYPEYRWVTAEEFNEALKVEKPLIERQLNDLETKVKQSVSKIDKFTYIRNFVNDLHDKDKMSDEDYEKFEKRCHEKFEERGFTIDKENQKLVRKDGTDVDETEFLKHATEVIEETCKEFNIVYKLPDEAIIEPIDTDSGAPVTEPEQSESESGGPDNGPDHTEETTTGVGSEESEMLPPPPESIELP